MKTVLENSSYMNEDFTMNAFSADKGNHALWKEACFGNMNGNQWENSIAVKTQYIWAMKRDLSQETYFVEEHE